MEEEVILNKIMEDAEMQANFIIKEANEKAEKLERDYKKKLEKQAQEQLELIKERIARKAAAEVEKKEFEAKMAELIEKKKIMDVIKGKVKQKIKDIEEEEYINIIDQKLKKYRNEKEVEVILPRKSYNALKNKAISYGMKVLEKNEEFETGVIIKCRNIEYNYDFEENMNYMNEEIEKDIDAILFK